MNYLWEFFGLIPTSSKRGGHLSTALDFRRCSHIVIIFANDEWRYKDDVVVMKFGLVMQHRPFSFGEGKEG